MCYSLVIMFIKKENGEKTRWLYYYCKVIVASLFKNEEKILKLIREYDVSSVPIENRRKLMVKLPNNSLGRLMSLELLRGVEFNPIGSPM